MPRRKNELTREELAEMYAGLLVHNLPQEIVVDRLTKIMSNPQLQVITGESPATVSRVVTGAYQWNFAAAQALYRFYQETCAEPIDARVAVSLGDVMPLYTAPEVEHMDKNIRNAVDSIETIVKQLRRNLLAESKTMRKQVVTPNEQINRLQDFAQEMVTPPFKPTAVKPPVKKAPQEPEITIEYKEATDPIDPNKKRRYWSDDHKHWFIARPDGMEGMAKTCGFESEQDPAFSTLQLADRVMLEFLNLTTLMHFDVDEENAMAENQLSNPKNFWLLHSRYGAFDNQYLRNQLGDAPVNLEPMFNTAEDMLIWKKRQFKWLKDNPEFVDKNGTIEGIEL